MVEQVVIPTNLVGNVVIIPYEELERIFKKYNCTKIAEIFQNSLAVSEEKTDDKIKVARENLQKKVTETLENLRESIRVKSEYLSSYELEKYEVRAQLDEKKNIIDIFVQADVLEYQKAYRDNKNINPYKTSMIYFATKFSKTTDLL